MERSAPNVDMMDSGGGHADEGERGREKTLGGEREGGEGTLRLRHFGQPDFLGKGWWVGD